MLLQFWIFVAHTFPSSLWTSNRPPSRSSITNPRTNAFSGSCNQTYLLPEKSLSPSNPRIWSAPRRSSSDLMNPGANVPELALFRAEFDRSRVADNPNVLDESWETDEFRKWPFIWLGSPVAPTIDDLGRAVFVGDSGEGETELRPKGLARLGEPFNWEGSIAMFVQWGIVCQS